MPDNASQSGILCNYIMKRGLLVFFLLLGSSFLFSQVVLTIEGTEFIDTIKGTSMGVNIPRSQPTIFTYRNNIITSVNSYGYLLQAGDEVPQETNNNLDGEIIIGNKFVWNGTDQNSWTHALFTGYNIDVVIKYNYLLNTPNGIQRKSDGMTDRVGVVAYNIINNSKVGIVVKGMKGVKIFNNTLYSEKTSAQTWRGLIDIHNNLDGGLSSISSDVKIFNNIFYTKNRIFNIKIYESACLDGFESDYNLFWCETGEPLFEINGETKTFTQWQALGYDTHSVLIDPIFNNTIDLIPLNRLDYGKDLGEEMKCGLAIDAIWDKTAPGTTDQNGVWQVGARIYEKVPENSKINIYPNPAKDFFNIYMNDPDLTYRKLFIYDLKGRLVFTYLVVYGLNEISLPKNIASGIYSIVLESPGLKRYTRNLIVVK